MEWLGSPELVLLLWCPLAVALCWHLAKPSIAKLPPQFRFATNAALIATPLLAIFVPYVPESPLRHFLPWKTPHAWGVTSTQPLGDSILGWLLPAVLVLGLITCLMAGTVASVRAAIVWNRLSPRKAGSYWITDKAPLIAATVGLVRPRVVIGSDIAQGEHLAPVLAHEIVHARRHHSLIVLVARSVARSWWWVPGLHAIVDDLVLASELWADDEARHKFGAKRTASAISDIALRATMVNPLVPQSVGFSGESAELHARAMALRSPRRMLNTIGVTAWAGATLGTTLLFVTLL